jgi:hypothetical protein
MKLPKTMFVVWGIVTLLALMAAQVPVVRAVKQASSPGEGQGQQPTVAIPTVTGTPIGPIIIVYADPEEQINVRSGPGTDYPRIGVLLNREEAPALGRTPAGDWVQIIYQGVDAGVAWVYAPLVRIAGGELPIVEPPPTPTPLVTPTIDPTLASQFVVQPLATQMPTFTPPPDLAIPTFQAEEVTTGTGGVPIGFVIIGSGLFGFFGLLFSFLRRR